VGTGLPSGLWRCMLLIPPFLRERQIFRARKRIEAGGYWEMLEKRLKYWMPRIFVLVFAMSLLMPAPRYISRMDASQFIVWAARLIWVTGLAVLCCAFIATAAFLGRVIKGKGRERPEEKGNREPEIKYPAAPQAGSTLRSDRPKGIVNTE